MNRLLLSMKYTHCIEANVRLAQVVSPGQFDSIYLPTIAEWSKRDHGDTIPPPATFAESIHSGTTVAVE
jgi:hypothetical protein